MVPTLGLVNFPFLMSFQGDMARPGLTPKKV